MWIKAYSVNSCKSSDFNLLWIKYTFLSSLDRKQGCSPFEHIFVAQWPTKYERVLMFNSVSCLPHIGLTIQQNLISGILKNENRSLYSSKSRTGKQPIGKVAKYFLKGPQIQHQQGGKKKLREKRDKKKRKALSVTFGNSLKLVSVHLANMSRGSRLQP